MNLHHSHKCKDSGNPNKTQENGFPNSWLYIYLHWAPKLIVNANSVPSLPKPPRGSQAEAGCDRSLSLGELEVWVPGSLSSHPRAILSLAGPWPPVAPPDVAAVVAGSRHWRGAGQRVPSSSLSSMRLPRCRVAPRAGDPQ